MPSVPLEKEGDIIMPILTPRPVTFPRNATGSSSTTPYLALHRPAPFSPANGVLMCVLMWNARILAVSFCSALMGLLVDLLNRALRPSAEPTRSRTNVIVEAGMVGLLLNRRAPVHPTTLIPREACQERKAQA
jgi:hypothetical protein